MITTKEQQNKKFNNYLELMKSIRSAKNSDYANDADSLANFRTSEKLGLPTWMGILIRLNDKVARLNEFCRKENTVKDSSFSVSEESFVDTCVDLANYAILTAIAFEEITEQKSPQEL